MKRITYWASLVITGILATALGCGETSPPATNTTAPKAELVKPAPDGAAQAAGWGTIRGRVVFAGEKAPERTVLQIEKDTEHCLAKGPILNESWIVNPKNRGVRFAVAFVKPAKGKSLPVHDSLKTPSPPEVVLDQPTCAFEPHVLAIREGQKILAKNPSPIVHNVMFQGFKNTQNVQIPPGGSHVFQPLPESGAIKLGCGAHPWMQGYLWVFEHPYFAVTDEDGNFEIKFVPAGAQNLILWQEAVNYVPDVKGRAVEVKPDAVVDVGEILIKPKD